MQATIRLFVLIAGIGSFGIADTSAGLAAPAGIPGRDAAHRETLVQPAQYGRCERLRLACIYKEERGEWGEGNCRRYRRECGSMSYCERLRRACVYKEYRGEVGEGNCRRYRRECLY